MFGQFKHHLQKELDQIRQKGLYKDERIILSPQRPGIKIIGQQAVLNLCANNYLGLAAHPEVIAAARASYDDWGYGLSSVRFICGTQEIHKELERKITEFLNTEDTLLYSSCFDANGGLFETLFTDQDAVISDELNHASIIDGIRLCRAQRFRYKNGDMNDLEEKLKAAQSARARCIATDGIFSMDGHIADLKNICTLAERYDALVMVDDSHGVGFMGPLGKGTHEHWDLLERVDILTGTLGKALGGASGGYTSGRKEIVALLRQRSRPYLFSNTLAPSIAAASVKVLDILSRSTELREKLFENTAFFRTQMTQAGFDILPGIHPIVPIMVGDAALSQKMAAKLLEKGIYVIGFFYPVVPEGKARIRVQVSAAHTREELVRAVEAFKTVKEALGL